MPRGLSLNENVAAGFANFAPKEGGRLASDLLRTFLSFLRGNPYAAYSKDLETWGGDENAVRLLAAGYLALPGFSGWLGALGLSVAVAPDFWQAHFACLVNASANVFLLSAVRNRKDPRLPIALNVLFYLGTIFLLSSLRTEPNTLFVLAAPIGIGSIIMFAQVAGWLVVAPVGALVLTALANLTGSSPAWLIIQAGPLTQLAILGFGLSLVALASAAWTERLAKTYLLSRVEEANHQMRENAARHRIAMEMAKVVLWDVADSSNPELIISDSIEAVTGYTASECQDVLINLERHVHPEDIAALRESAAIAHESTNRVRMDVRLKTKNQEYRWFALRARFFGGSSGHSQVSGSIQDIDFVKKAELALRTARDKAELADRSKSAFIATMSHEVRTPLNAILGAVETLKRRNAVFGESEMLHLIDDAGKGLLAIVNDLLDLSRIEAGKIQIVAAPTNLTSLVRRTVAFWRPQANAKGLTLEFVETSADDISILADPGRIRQILGNLLSNAVKFTHAGTIRVEVSSQSDGADNTRVSIAVTDSGCGIAPNDRELIFSAFEQSQPAGALGGSGLGLFISRNLARRMNGDLVLAETDSAGSTFLLTLHAETCVTPRTSHTEPTHDPAWAGYSVLCVDDNASNLKIAKALLSMFGLDVSVSNSGMEAIELCRQTPFDAILLDIVMPGMNGFETLAALRTDQQSTNGDTPIIALTARLSPSDIAKYEEQGFDAIAGKPINVEDLARTLTPLLSIRRSLASQSQ